MTGGYTRPTAAELVAAVADFLDTAFLNRDGRAATDERIGFHARVAANALRIVERELLAVREPGFGAALVGLGFADESALAAAIRAGELDDRTDEVLACLRILVQHRLTVDHPGYDGD